MSWSVHEISSNVHQITISGAYKNTGWEQWIMLSGDRHHDNLHSDHRLQKKHLEEARQKGAAIIDVGDFFCLMQGRYDRRKSADALRPEHQVDDYFDAVPNTAVEFFKPYADLFAVIGYGNHEMSIFKHHQTDVLERFVYRLNAETGSSVFAGGYGGYVKLQFQFEDGSNKKSKMIKYYHGSGGGGPVTKGVIQTARRAVYMPDADVIVTGHIHNKWTMILARERITAQGRIFLDEQVHISVGGYKEEYGQGKDGWHVERGAPPKPLGGYWLRITFDPNAKEFRIQAIDTV